MPTLITRGSVSVKAYGFGGGALVAPSGTFAIFALGYVCGTGSARTNKYTYAGCVSASATSLCSVLFQGSAVGSTTQGIFTLANGNTKARKKYTYSGCIVSCAASASKNGSSGGGAGNSTVGIIAIGISTGCCCACGSPYMDKYTYASDSSSASSARWTYGFHGGAAAGTSTAGIFQVGHNNYPRNKYTYSSCTVALATAATGNLYGVGASAAGNACAGIFTSYGGYANRQKYVYSNDTNAAAASASHSYSWGSAAGNATIGIFALGYYYCCVKYRDKYTYSSDTSAAGSAASAASFYGAAASNGVTGVNT